ncbi:hypothetical protein SERLA73DRAFT_159582 [Serpula lacrymans var. lacrymans S7.3]|uniref:Glucose-methanol-choline oxidoreductase N-terminal domain-containing protein n=1 Tax=Serpula lacrymans var. lacrymans (strain S7.3) TaxID=936435 RepID=F8PTH7_SERL3|nr:hypothetical protein SERLA73DRAFT_159582 [Serpula lacrymans var. lacrymans S7.3]
MQRLVYSFQHSFVKKTKFHKDGVRITPEFDFVVVGGGPAGCALATRLSEGGKFSVLLLEQGTSVEQHPELEGCMDYILQTRALHGSSFDAEYSTVSEGQFCPHELKISSGKVLGGSSCINWAIWTRGAKDDYELWAQLAGNEEFSWKRVVHYFSQIEKPTGGPISVRSVKDTPRDHYWSDTASLSLGQAGFQRLDGLNNGDLLGYGEMMECLDENGFRCSANAYVRAAAEEMKRQPETGEAARRFEIWTSIEVQRVVFEDVKVMGEEPKAIGVHTPFGFIRASHEVILTAGTVKSAHLMLLSGIGPAGQLTEHGISVIVDSPEVGENLWEHPFVDVRFKVKDHKRRDTVEDFATLKTSARHVDKWAKTKSGLMSGLLYEWMAFSNFGDRLRTALPPDQTSVSFSWLEYLRSQISQILPFRLFYSSSKPSLRTFTPLEEKYLFRPGAPHIEQMVHYGHGLTQAPDPLETSYISISNVLLTPVSRGSVTLASAPADADASTTQLPRIVVNQLKEEVDRELLVAALEKSYEISRTPAWAEFLEAEETPSKDKLIEIIRDRVSTLWHLGGTCSMRTKDTRGVVDNAFRVQGVKGLRIAAPEGDIPDKNPKISAWYLSQWLLTPNLSHIYSAKW